jgi:hypothetical protein
LTRVIRRRLFTALVLAASSAALRTAPAVAQGGAASAPPSPEEVLGYPLGAHFTTYDGVLGYSRALAAASPLVEVVPYGTTAERRELIQLVIARPDYRQRLAEILAANAELTRPETSPDRAREIAATNPAIVYFSYGIHGNEASSSEAAMWTAWDLARGAAEVAGVLDSAIVIIDPVANPDGRDRYVQWFRSVVGDTPNPDPAVREHREPWPGGRFNHYLFDLNRDWAWASQPETRARLATWLRWNPQVHVDFHEMGPNSTYFFFPAAAPINPIYPSYILDWASRFGAGNARAFDERGWAYFTGDDYDFFYPGYGDTWPSLTGAIGMTYEQAGGEAAGLAFERASGDTLTLEDRIAHHRLTGETTLRVLTAARSRLLHDYAAGQRVVGEREPDVLLVPGQDTMRARSLVRHLLREGIEVERADGPFRAEAREYAGYAPRSSFPAGSYRVRARQPRGRLATTLLQPRTRLDAEYSYDISAWSLPYAYAVEAYEVRGETNARWSPVAATADSVAATTSAPPAAYGYLLRPGDAASAGVVRYLRAGGSASVLSRAVTAAGRGWPAGSWFLPAASDSARARLTRAGLGALVTPVATGLAEDGPDLGSTSVWPVRLPRVAVLTGDGVLPTSYGASWYFLERELGLPFDALLAADLGDLDLSHYEVVVLPDADDEALNEAGRTALRGWVERGGRLVALAGGARVAAPLFDVHLRPTVHPDTTSPDSFLTTRTQRDLREWLDGVAGVILPARLDMGHPLAWGSGAEDDGGELQLLHVGDLAFEPGPGQEVVAYFPAGLRATSGVIADAKLKGLERSAWLTTRTVGKGSVILFADDPLFRLFWRATQPLYTNALLIGARK